MKDYGSVILKHRKVNNLTQKELAEKLFVTPQAISKWEKNLSEPDLDTIRKLADLFNISIDDFFNESKEIVEEIVEETKCLWCNESFLSKDLSKNKSYPICLSCEKENEESKKQIEIYSKDALKKGLKIKNASFKSLIIWSVVLFVGTLGITLWAFFSNSINQDMLIGGLVFSVLFPLFVVQLFRDGPIQDIFSYFATISVRMPGIIFSLSIDGLVFLIVVKLLFGIITMLISALMMFIGFIICLTISPFTFIYMLIKYKKGEELI